MQPRNGNEIIPDEEGMLLASAFIVCIVTDRCGGIPDGPHWPRKHSAIL